MSEHANAAEDVAGDPRNIAGGHHCRALTSVGQSNALQCCLRSDRYNHADRLRIHFKHQCLKNLAGLNAEGKCCLSPIVLRARVMFECVGLIVNSGLLADA